MFKDAPVQFNYYSMVEARALVTNYYQPTWARRLWRHYLSSLTGGAGSLLLTVVFYPLFSRRMDTRVQMLSFNVEFLANRGSKYDFDWN